MLKKCWGNSVKSNNPVWIFCQLSISLKSEDCIGINNKAYYIGKYFYQEIS
ncbi:hypothetical protein SAMN05518856_10196 [Paenibacillus sp. OK003]|nr:hypothetical protein SAMN05518856_10196 [Paenibacillus sp. OK003]